MSSLENRQHQTREADRFGGDVPDVSDEMLEELRLLSAYAERRDALAVASVAYRVRRMAQRSNQVMIEQGAARIEQAARSNNTEQFTSDIQLLGHQLRWNGQQPLGGC